MKNIFSIIATLFLFISVSKAQTITYSEVEKSDSRNANFEILGKFGDNFLIYKNISRRHDLTVYNFDMTIKEILKLDFVSDKTDNIDFVTYPDHFLMIWQYQKNNIIYCKGANLDGAGNLTGNVMDIDTTKVGLFSNVPSYDLTWSEDKKKILMYKVQTRNDEYNLTTKVFNEMLIPLDSMRTSISYNDRREAFGDLQINNEGTIVFTKEKQNSRPEFINTLEVNFKKLNDPLITTTPVPLDEQLIQDVRIKIDNLNKQYLINSFAYRKYNGNVGGMFTALINDSLVLTKKVINEFDDTLRQKLSNNPGYRSAFDDFYLKNIILKKDGGFIIAAEEYTRRSRFGGNYDDRYSPYSPYNPYYRYYSSPSDYYLFNRGYYGYYRPYGASNRDIIYNYDDIIAFGFNKDLKLQWNNVINKTTSDIETDNFLSFANMNAGSEIHFLFLQKDNNKQIISDHALQPNGEIIRYATLKSKETGWYFMPRLARQTGARQMIIPCIVRNNIAFAKIDF